jgi:hypothetical protein
MGAIDPANVQLDGAIDRAQYASMAVRGSQWAVGLK